MYSKSWTYSNQRRHSNIENIRNKMCNMCALTQHHPNSPTITNHINLANFSCYAASFAYNIYTYKIITADEKSSKAFDWKIYLKFSHQIALSISRRKSSAKYVSHRENAVWSIHSYVTIVEACKIANNCSAWERKLSENGMSG